MRFVIAVDNSNGVITKPTTLILGAGASAPFGFPTGNQLLQRVLALTNPLSLPKQNWNNAPLNFEENEIERFHNELLNSGQESVDSFLEYRQEFIPIGKTAIAMALIINENENTLFNPIESNWYRYLFNQLAVKFEDFCNNRLNILTFNYDRSLEHFLLTALKNRYGKPKDECANILNKIPIIHLHGDLGGLTDFDQANGLFRNYDTQITTTSLDTATRRILIIHEGIESPKFQSQFIRAKHILSTSEVICFLGFGYHILNMERLGFNTSRGPRNPYTAKSINGTTMGLTTAEVEQINLRCGLGLRRHGNHGSGYYDVLQHLKEMGTLHGN